MNAAILAVGSEMLTADKIDTNVITNFEKRLADMKAGKI